MILRIGAVIGLLAVGIGAVVFAMGGPGLFAPTPASTYLTATAAVATVTKDVAATGKVQAANIYGIRFGQTPVGVTAAGTGGGGNAGASGTTWPVKVVNVTVGQAVKKGDVMAVADATYANAQLAVAQANVDAAQTKLTSDTNGADAATRATLQDSINQAKLNLTNAKQGQSITTAQNKLTLQGAQDVVDTAQAKLDTDTANAAADGVLASDALALESAKNKNASTKLQVQQSNNNAAQQVSNADLNVTSAQHNYDLKVAPASAAQIATDQAALLTAQSGLVNAQNALNYSTLIAPEDGVVSAVNLTAGAAAPTGDAITLQSAALQVVASATETDVSSLKVAMDVTVTVNASTSAIAGKLLTISPVAAGGAGASVVTYQIVVGLTSVPAGVLSGMTAQVSIRIAQAANVVAVPAAAVNGTKGSYTVRVMDAAGQPQRHSVTVGLVTSTLAEIQSGINAGDVVVTGLASQRVTTTTTTTGGGGLGGGGLGGLGGGGGGGVQVPGR